MKNVNGGGSKGSVEGFRLTEVDLQFAAAVNLQRLPRAMTIFRLVWALS